MMKLKLKLNLNPIRPLAVLLAATALAGSMQAGTIVRVSIQGEVEFNGITSGGLGMVNVGDAATLSFLVDSADFQDSASFPTRGYVIDQGSFGLAFPGGTAPLVSPYPAGTTPYFVIRDNDPAVDGFLVSDSVDFPTGVALQPAGVFGNFVNNFYVTYGGSLLPSLDILDAIGTYDFTGLTVFNWTIQDGPFDAMGLLFESMTIEIEAPWVDLGGGTVGINGQPTLETFGPLTAGSDTTIQLTDAAPNAPMVVWLALTNPAPFAALGGTIYTFPFNLQLLRMSDAAGSFSQTVPWPAGVPSGIDIRLQFLVQDFSSIHGITLSNAEECTTP